MNKPNLVDYTVAKFESFDIFDDCVFDSEVTNEVDGNIYAYMEVKPEYALKIMEALTFYSSDEKYEQSVITSVINSYELNKIIKVRIDFYY